MSRTGDIDIALSDFMDFWYDHVDSKGEHDPHESLRVKYGRLIVDTCPDGCCQKSIDLTELAESIRQLTGRPTVAELKVLAAKEHKRRKKQYLENNPDIMHEEARGPVHHMEKS